MSHHQLRDATSATKNLGIGGQHVGEEADNALPLTQMTTALAPGGGLVTGVQASSRLEVAVINYDTEGCPEETTLVPVPLLCGQIELATVEVFEAGGPGQPQRRRDVWKAVQAVQKKSEPAE